MATDNVVEENMNYNFDEEGQRTMNILITGAKGFLGTNLVKYLHTLADGRNRTRPGLHIGEIYEYDRENTEADLDEYCSKADFVVNLAGVNRPKDTSEFQAGNFGFASTLLDTLKKHNNQAPVILSSSLQAAMVGRFSESEYGKSKLAGEELFFEYSQSTGAAVYVYRYPNLVGAGVRPNYNSAVGTFCYNYAHDLPITINDPGVELELLFAADLIEELLDAMEGHPHRCEYPATGTTIDGITYDGLTPKACADGRYCYSPVTHKATLGEIVTLLDSFKAHSETLMVPDFTPGSFEKKLYSMYLSYLPPEKTIFDLKMNVDSRGSFTELLHTADRGQVSVNVCRPGITRGMHWHVTKAEEFIVVSGKARIRERKIGTNEIEEYIVDGSRIQSVIMKPGFSHEITNIGEGDLVTVMNCNEVFDPEKPDTFFERIDI